jgi:hypothetical protein
MGNEIVRISVRVPERYRRRLKIAAAAGGEKLEEWCLRAWNAQLEQPGAPQVGPMGELTAEEQRLLEHYLSLIRLDKGLAEVSRKRIEQFLTIAREQPAALNLMDEAALSERVAKDALRIAMEQIRALGQLPPSPGVLSGNAGSLGQPNSEVTPLEPPSKTG